LEIRTALCGTPARQALQRARRALADFLACQGAPGIDLQLQPGFTYRPGRSGKVQRVLRRG